MSVLEKLLASEEADRAVQTNPGYLIVDGAKIDVGYEFESLSRATVRDILQDAATQQGWTLSTERSDFDRLRLACQAGIE